MYPTIETTYLRKYSKRRFKSKRLRKKQVSTLRDAYHRLSKNMSAGWHMLLLLEIYPMLSGGYSA